jgi:hypothetical protein
MWTLVGHGKLSDRISCLHTAPRKPQNTVWPYIFFILPSVITTSFPFETCAVAIALLKLNGKLYSVPVGSAMGGRLRSISTTSHLHLLPETQKMLLMASETTEEERKQSYGEMFSVYCHASFVIHKS